MVDTSIMCSYDKHITMHSPMKAAASIVLKWPANLKHNQIASTCNHM